MKYLLTITSLLLIISACSRSESFEHRLNTFYNAIQNETIIKEFKKGNLQKTTDLVEQEFLKKPLTKQHFNKVKKMEGINLFTTYQTVEFFYTYLYKKK